MAENTPASSTGTNQGDIDAWLESILGSAGMSAEAQIEAARIGAEAMLEQQSRGQQFIREGADKASELYSPYAQGGLWALQQWRDQYGQGAPKFSWNRNFEYSPFEWNRNFSYQTLPEYMQGRLGPENLKDSPYYGLYEFQNAQQQDAINRQLRARGLYGSGAGMKEALAKSTGLEQQFAADEYARAMQEYGIGYDQAYQQYMTDYEQALQKHNIGYEEAKQKYGMDYDQYLKQFGADYGAYQDRLNQAAQMGQYGWLGTQGMANAAFGAGSQMGNQAIQTGQALAGLQSNLGQGLASTYNAQGNTLAGLYNSAMNRNLTQNMFNQGQANWNYANNANQTLGYANLGAGLLRSGLDAYRYYNQPTPTGAGNLYGGYYGNTFNPNTGITYGYSGTGGDYGGGYW